MNEPIIPELTKLVATATITTETGGTPDSGTVVNYKLIDEMTGTIIIPSTPVPLVGKLAVVTIPADKNVCLSESSRSEIKRLVITAEGLTQIVHKYTVEQV